MMTPWMCPACGLQIRHERDSHEEPRVGVIYRCHICRLELVYDENKKRLALAPFPESA